MQSPLHSACPGGHTISQAPISQRSPGLHAFSQAPQCCALVWMSTQPELHSVLPNEQPWVWHCPLRHCAVASQALLHEPQCCRLDETSTQAPSQSVVPAGHSATQAPSKHDSLIPQAFSQAPQWLGSVFVEMQVGAALRQADAALRRPAVRRRPARPASLRCPRRTCREGSQPRCSRRDPKPQQGWDNRWPWGRSLVAILPCSDVAVAVAGAR